MTRNSKLLTPYYLLLTFFCSTDQPCNVVFHDRFTALVFDPLAVSHDAAAACGNRFAFVHFDFDLDRVADLHRAKQAHLVQSREGHAGAVDNAGLHGQSFGHAECQTARRDALAVQAFVSNVFQIQEQRFGETDKGDELQNVVLGDRAPTGGEAVTWMELFKGFAVHITFFLFKWSISVVLMFSHEDKTSSVCWPSKGGGKRTDAGVAENFTGMPAMRTAPTVGWSTSTNMSRWRT